MPEPTQIPATSFRRVEADGVSVFYREAGAADAPVVLLLHGFPTSSFQYRELIPRLADKYRVIAPDLPGFGFTEVPVATQLQVHLRQFGQNHPRVHRCAQSAALRSLRLRLRRAHRFPPRHGSSGTHHRHRFAEWQRLRAGTGRCVGTDPPVLAKSFKRKSRSSAQRARPRRPARPIRNRSPQSQRRRARRLHPRRLHDRAPRQHGHPTRSVPRLRQ